MNLTKITDYFKGWVVGNFNPSLFQTKDFEVAIKFYKKGDYEPNHLHKISTEYTVILDGQVEMSGIKYISGDILEIKPNQATDFRALSDVKTVVVKSPSSINDKYIIK
jgi:quercetin dioxygenase-like cupin family protein